MLFDCFNVFTFAFLLNDTYWSEFGEFRPGEAIEMGWGGEENQADRQSGGDRTDRPPFWDPLSFFPPFPLLLFDDDNNLICGLSPPLIEAAGLEGKEGREKGEL